MRIVAGRYRSMKLMTLTGNHTRPTLDKVKEAVFSSLNEKVIEASFLDLFAGSGAIGLEAYSRGARQVYLNDSHYEAYKVIKANIEHLKADVTLTKSDYKDCICDLETQGIKMDVIYLDPPFDQINYHDMLQYVMDSQLITSQTIIILECDRSLELDVNHPRFMTYKQANYGRIKVTYFKEVEND